MATESSLRQGSARAMEDRCFSAVVYVLVPGLVLGELALQWRSGNLALMVVMPLVMGLGGAFVAASHLYAAEKVRAKFLMPIVAVVSAAVGILHLGYGISVLLGGGQR
jgi:uncharacterized membrane protein YeaQ/YmgE (transglycosylase-associated protein family)